VLCWWCSLQHVCPCPNASKHNTGRYYDPGRIALDFGRIKEYAPPKKIHPSSIMSVSNTGGHGRGDQRGRIIGDVINHGKHEFWGKQNVHYHQGMAAGENTLNAVCARLVTRGITAEKGTYSNSRFLKDYVQFMTTPGSHNDTYAESFHRDFFQNWAAGISPEKCAGKEGHNTPTIGGFVMLPPVVLASMWKGEQLMRQTVVTHLRTTHDSDLLAQRAELFASLLSTLVKGQVPPAEAIQAAGKQLSMDLPALVRRAAGNDGAVVGRMFSTACYITDSLPSVLYLAAAHGESFEDAVVANTNLGGENCHRGSALGAIMGAALGESRIPKRFITGLAASSDIKSEIDDFIAAIMAQNGATAASL